MLSNRQPKLHENAACCKNSRFNSDGKHVNSFILTLIVQKVLEIKALRILILPNKNSIWGVSVFDLIMQYATYLLHLSNQRHGHHKYANKDVNSGFRNVKCETSPYGYPVFIVNPR